MNLREHESSDSMKVWLSESDTETLLDAAETTEQRIAFALGARCGLRSHEILEVTPDDVVEESDAGTMLKVRHGKGDKYRETPMPTTLAREIQTIAEIRDKKDSTPLISVTTTQSLRNWIKSTRQVVAEKENDERWHQVSLHDLRRTWATQLASRDVDPLIVCDWGGWNDLETFLDHYKGVYSPDAQRREREKVDWL